ncbi:MAG: ribonuclease P protein component [Odoribacteraceae bacterium]|jgi:ribonuclease P protein component|nr:ribonuclease P protein component [Odoribacteraceae bacterium]
MATGAIPEGFARMETTRRHTFSKGERLYLKHRFDALLAGKDSFISYPLRVIFRFSVRDEGEAPARVAVSVSKRRFKRAVDRNRIKRLTREAYRLNKHDLHDLLPPGQGVDMLLIYLGETVVDFVKIEKAIQGVIKKMHGVVEKRSGLATTPAD